MPKHEHFEELCAAASIGQASGAELAELREHLAWCRTCQDRYSEFLSINAEKFAKDANAEALTREEAVSSIDSVLLRQRFLKKAAEEGIVFSESGSAQPLPEPLVAPNRSWSRAFPFAPVAVGLALLAVVGGGGYFLGKYRAQVVVIASSVAIKPAGTIGVQQRKDALASLEQENQDLIAQVALLESSLRSANSQLSKTETHNSESEDDRLVLLAKVKERDESIQSLLARLDQAQTALASLRADYEKTQLSVSSNQAALIEDQVKIRELSEQLAENSNSLTRERDLLAAGRDIRELMAARNLHIVDVFDTDPKGKTRPAFGRIFFTEGKSLLFYAYDMPDARLKDAGYHYRIWGKKEGPNQRARSLGIFFSDDKSQKRWVFQYDDPKVLDEIDSVFVTLEPPNGNSTQPKGDKLLYAYLKGQANHP